MELFKITDIKHFPKDERDHPLDELDIPLSLQIQADSELDDTFGLSDQDYDNIDNISPVIDKQVQDSSEEPEGGQYQDELDQPLSGEEDQSYQDSEMDMDLNAGYPEEGGMGEEDLGEQDPNFQGIIRTVKGANLVYKRESPDNTFTELWIYNVGKDMRQESQIKRAILAGTDLDPTNGASVDGKQNMDLFTLGNIQFLQINGIQS